MKVINLFWLKYWSRKLDKLFASALFEGYVKAFILLVLIILGWRVGGSGEGSVQFYDS